MISAYIDKIKTGESLRSENISVSPIDQIKTWKLQDQDNTGTITHPDSSTGVWQKHTNSAHLIQTKLIGYFSIYSANHAGEFWMSDAVPEK